MTPEDHEGGETCSVKTNTCRRAIFRLCEVRMKIEVRSDLTDAADFIPVSQSVSRSVPK